MILEEYTIISPLTKHIIVAISTPFLDLMHVSFQVLTLSLSQLVFLQLIAQLLYQLLHLLTIVNCGLIAY